MKMSLKNKIQQLSKDFHTEVIKHRRYLHQHPELSFEEVATGKYIAAVLENLGIEYQHGCAVNGVVGLIKGKNPDKKVIALRGDIDALPIQEENDVPYKSTKDGLMHACGHDVHTSSLIGTAMILHALREEFEGTVKLIFQPAEEKLPGGASIMIKEGVLTNPTPESIFGQHVHPPLAVGKIGMRPGMYMASTDEFHVTIKGKGGHAALPQDCVDPIVIMSHMIIALQQIVSRKSDPTMPTVLSFGKVTANGATNVIPSEVKLEGTFRTMDEQWRAKAHQQILSIAKGIVEGMGGILEFNIVNGYPSLINDERLTIDAKKWAVEYLGAENVVDLPIRMTAEDFSYFTQEMPACFYRLGIRNDSKGINSPLHTSTFDIDEKALETGMGVMAWFAIKELGN